MRLIVVTVLSVSMAAWWFANDTSRRDADDMIAERLVPAPGSVIWRTPEGNPAAAFGLQAAAGMSMGAYAWVRLRRVQRKG